jgi:hypothetical protein
MKPTEIHRDPAPTRRSLHQYRAEPRPRWPVVQRVIEARTPPFPRAGVAPRRDRSSGRVQLRSTAHIRWGPAERRGAVRRTSHETETRQAVRSRTSFKQLNQPLAQGSRVHSVTVGVEGHGAPDTGYPCVVTHGVTALGRTMSPSATATAAPVQLPNPCRTGEPSGFPGRIISSTK